MSTTYEVVTDVARLREIEPAWSALWQRIPQATPFQSPHWVLPWWDHFAQDKALAVVTACVDGELALVLPLCLVGETLVLIGTGNTDRMDVLANEAAPVEPALQLLDALPWRSIDLQQLGSASVVLALPGERLDGEPCPAVPLPAPVSAHFAKRLDKSRCQLAARGTVSFVVDASTEAFGDFCELHRRRWAARGEAGVLDARSQVFLWDVVQRSPCTRVGVLKCGDEAVAAYLGFLHRDVLYSYLGGFAPELQRIGIGNLLIDSAMKAVQEEGASTFDFLRGREAYKYRWGASDRPTFRWRRMRGQS